MLILYQTLKFPNPTASTANVEVKDTLVNTLSSIGEELYQLGSDRKGVVCQDIKVPSILMDSANLNVLPKITVLDERRTQTGPSRSNAIQDEFIIRLH